MMRPVRAGSPSMTSRSPTWAYIAATPLVADVAAVRYSPCPSYRGHASGPGPALPGPRAPGTREVKTESPVVRPARGPDHRHAVSQAALGYGPLPGLRVRLACARRGMRRARHGVGDGRRR